MDLGFPRTCLGCINVFFFFVGMFLFIVSSWCAFDANLFELVNSRIIGPEISDVLAKFFKLRLWNLNVSYVAVALSCAVIMMAVFGLLGAGCKSKCSLQMYTLILTVVIIFIIWTTFTSGVWQLYSGEKYEMTSFKNYGSNDNLETIVLNYAMVNLECCGLHNYTDFNLTYWRRNNPNERFPKQCCKFDKIQKVLDPTCIKNTSNASLESNKNIGCLVKIREYIHENILFVGMCLVIVFIFYVVVAFFTYIVSRGTEKNDDAEESVYVSENVYFPEQNVATVSPETGRRVTRVVSSVNPFAAYRYEPSHPVEI